MFATLLQVVGLALILVAGVLVSIPVAVAAVGVVAVYVGLAAERD
jgi:hypothetical protein